MDLPNYLFWDTEINKIDFKKNARFVIQRVIQKGSIDDWIVNKDFYRMDLLKREILLIRDLDAKSLNFFSVIFDVNKRNFRCFSIQQSIPKHFNY